MAEFAEGIERPVATGDVEALPDAPPVPDSLEDTGLAETFVADLILKTFYEHGALLGRKLADHLCLPFGIIDDQVLKLQQQQFLEVRGTEGAGRSVYVYDLTGSGRSRARELSNANPYVGPAPVLYDDYWSWVKKQGMRDARLTRDEIFDGLRHLVLDEEFVDRLGPAINSGESLFLFGHSGNGKTAIAEAIAEMFGEPIYMPRTVKIEGQIVQVFDLAVHTPVDGSEGEGEEPLVDSALVQQPDPHDQRFVRVERPTVMTGGELTLDQLELQHDRESGVYRAPPQMKANGGVFVIDDFGRQRVQPRNLLNRWIYPLERGADFLSLPTGQKIMVPFEALIIFATNLNPVDLVEEAFLRRIRYKILVDDPTREQYAEIFRRFSSRAGITFRDEAVDYVYDEFYEPLGRPPRSCHPRDLIKHVLDVAQYKNVEPALSPDLLQRAGQDYFLDLPASMFKGGGAEDEEPESYGIA